MGKILSVLLSWWVWILYLFYHRLAGKSARLAALNVIKAITLLEIENLLKPLPHGFSIDKSGIVTAISPQGQKIVSEVGPYLIYEDEKYGRIHIYFHEKTGPWFHVREEKHLLPIIELAEMIHAKVQGDEEEIYTRESVLGDG